MTKINRPDTLLTELRDIKRRLRLLEAGRMRPQAAIASGVPVSGTPLLPVRPADWPATSSAEWERLFAGPWGAIVELRVAADPDTTGEARVLVDGQPVGEPVTATSIPAVHTVSAGPGAEVTVEARRSDGPGLIRVAASLRTG
jgi:hypothetical protein